MDTYIFKNGNPIQKRTEADNLPCDFIWIDALREDVVRDPAAWKVAICEQTQIHLDEFHITDILNTQHPSNYDLTHEYEILIFRKLLSKTQDTVTLDPAALYTSPVVFIITPNALITVRESVSQTFDTLKLRLLQNKDALRTRLPGSPLELSLRILNALVDKYLELRSPLTRRIDLWQKLLLQGNQRFNNWQQLLNERLALHQLDNLCEEQIDALQELRNEYLDQQTATITEPPSRRDILSVRLNDLMEHVNRVQNHAARLEDALKSAVELHFSATAHQTNENLRFLAILSAVFAPLTLLTGIYGMNFAVIPGLHNPDGFWWMMGIMAGVTIGLLYYFRYRQLVWRKEKTVKAMFDTTHTH